MQITTTEQVTRTYCDVCMMEVTGENHSIDADSTTCMTTRFEISTNRIKQYSNRNRLMPLTLTCHDIAEFRVKYPHVFGNNDTKQLK